MTRRLPLPRHLVPGVLVALAGASAAAAPTAHGAGLPLDARLGVQRALLALHDGRQDLVIAPELARDGRGRGALLLAVPATPTVTRVPAAAAGVFGALDRATAPLPSPDTDDEADRPAPAPRGADVTVLSRQAIGDYDVARLRAGDGDALRTWLTRNGYATPRAAAPVLRDYVRRGWAFVAIRLDGPAPAAARPLAPLRIRFAADELVYPMRLTAAAGRPVSVELYVVGRHRVTARGFDTYHAGSVAALRPALTPAVRKLVGGPYLTRLGIQERDPERAATDVRFEQGVSDRLFRASEDYPFESEAGFATAPLPSELPSASTEAPLEDAPGGAAWLLLFPGVAVVVVVVLGVVRLRRRGQSQG